MVNEEIKEIMTAYAQDAVSVAARRDVALDYSEESLGAIDELIGCEAFIGPTPRTPDSQEDENTLWELSKMFGAYVGEVTLRVLGGRWLGEPDSDGGVRAVVEIQGLRGFPVDKIWKRLTDSEFDAVGGYCRAIRKILEQQAGAGAE